jgi:hypothetical protein
VAQSCRAAVPSRASFDAFPNYKQLRVLGAPQVSTPFLLFANLGSPGLLNYK